MTTTFFTSDSHFGHRLMALLRGFAPTASRQEDVTERQLAAHDWSIVDAWNRAVAPDDIVWHLGDLTLKNPELIGDLLSALNGRKRLIVGNHDRAHPMFGEKAVAAQGALQAVGFEYVASMATVKIPPTKQYLAAAGGSAPAHRVLLSHYPYDGDHTEGERGRQWRLRDEGGVLLHGHTHSCEAVHSSAAREIHVGWDAWGRPVAAHEVAAAVERSSKVPVSRMSNLDERLVS